MVLQILYLASGSTDRSILVAIQWALILLIIQYLIEEEDKEAMYTAINIIPPNNTKEIKYKVQIEQ
jgi:hypothetical protein